MVFTNTIVSDRALSLKEKLIIKYEITNMIPENQILIPHSVHTNAIHNADIQTNSIGNIHLTWLNRLNPIYFCVKKALIK